MDSAMSLFRLPVQVCDIVDAMNASPAVDAIVDTGSELTWLPATVLEGVGIKRVKRKEFITATGEKVLRDVGYGLIRASGFETVDEVVFGEAGDQALLGARTMEGFAVVADPMHKRLVSTTSIAAAAPE